jgi:hypothetical protein
VLIFTFLLEMSVVFYFWNLGFYFGLRSLVPGSKRCSMGPKEKYGRFALEISAIPCNGNHH